MFNGIIYNTGLIKNIKKTNNSVLLAVQTNLKFKESDVGSSICCNGVCLTLIKLTKKIIYFYVSKETLNRSNFKYLKVGSIINIEKSLIYGQKISGHFVQGHVDTTASIRNITLQDKTWIIRFSMKDKKLFKYLVEKASISINGVSLTISKVKKSHFEICVIPHTLKLTNLKNMKIKKIVNVELDIFTKYILKISQ